MKILEVIEFLTLEKGGSVESVRLLARYLARLGHQVTVCTSDFRLNPTLTQSEGFEIAAFKTLFHMSNFYVSPSLLPWARNRVREFDVVHLNNFRSFQNAVVAHYASKHGIPYVLSPRGSLPRDKGRAPLKTLYDCAVGDRILKHAAQLHALSYEEKAQYEANHVSSPKIKLIPNGIDLAQFQASRPRGSFRRRYKIGDQERIVLFLGRLHSIKRIDLLIRAFHPLTLKMEGLKLVIVGPDDGHLSSLLRLVRELRLGEKVLFTGPLFHQDKVMAYYDADLFVAPSLYEIFNRTILEAWACSLPVIVVGRHGMLDWLDEEVAVAVDSSETSLTAAMNNLLTDETERQRRANDGRKAVTAKFSMEVIAKQFEELFDGVIRESHRVSGQLMYSEIKAV